MLRSVFDFENPYAKWCHELVNKVLRLPVAFKGTPVDKMSPTVKYKLQTGNSEETDISIPG